MDKNKSLDDSDFADDLLLRSSTHQDPQEKRDNILYVKLV